MVEATVECLINLETRTWNHELVDGLFIPSEAELIKKIPQSVLLRTLFFHLFWPLEQSGHYSCKSGYQILKEEEDGCHHEEPPAFDHSLWRKIWSLNLKIKLNTLWRACKNSFPTKSNLVCHHLIDDHSCDRCPRHLENLIHVVGSFEYLEFLLTGNILEFWGTHNWDFQEW